MAEWEAAINWPTGKTALDCTGNCTLLYCTTLNCIVQFFTEVHITVLYFIMYFTEVYITVRYCNKFELRWPEAVYNYWGLLYTVPVLLGLVLEKTRPGDLVMPDPIG